MRINKLSTARETVRGGRARSVLEQHARKVDVVERVGHWPLRLLIYIGLHASRAVLRHLLRQVLEYEQR